MAPLATVLSPGFNIQMVQVAAALHASEKCNN